MLQQWYVSRGASKPPQRSTPPNTAPVWLLNTAPGGTSPPPSKLLMLRAPAGLSAPGSLFISPDGTELVATVSQRTGNPIQGRWRGEFAVYSARTGALIRTHAPWTWGGATRPRPGRFPDPAVAWSDRSGSRLLVIQPRDGVNRLAVLMGNRVVLSGSSFLPSLPAAYVALQDALQNVYAVPPHMAW